jgi:hypothetical protein
MGYGLSTATSQNALDRSSNQLAINPNAQSMELNRMLAESYSQQADEIGMLKDRITQLREQLVSQVKLLEMIRGWFFEAVERQKQELPPDAKKILEVMVEI